MMSKMSFRLRIFRIVMRFFQLLTTLIFILPVISSRSWAIVLFRKLINLFEHQLSITMLRFRSKDVHLTEGIIADVPVTWFHPDKLVRQDKLVIYLHGGAWFVGSLKTHGALISKMASYLGCRILYIDYALAPEHKFPKAMDQISVVYNAITAVTFKPADIVIGGDSAGGGLTVALLQKLRNEGRPLPAAAFLESPAVDLSLSAPSIIENRWSEVLLPSAGRLTRWAAKRLFKNHYAGSRSLIDPEVSPLFGSFEGLPPLYVAYSEHEIMRDDAKRMIAKARQQGVEITEKSYQYTLHTSYAFYVVYPEAYDGLMTAMRFVESQFSKSPSF